MEYEKIRMMLAQQLKISVDEIDKNTLLIEDLGMDSLDIMQMIACIEREFDIQLGDLQPGDIETVGDAVDYIIRKV